MRHTFQHAGDAIKTAEERTGEKFDILPCPHCGHYARLADPEKDPNLWGGYQWAIICSSSHCRAMMTVVADGYFEQVDMELNPGSPHNGYYDRVTNLRSRWNRRVVAVTRPDTSTDDRTLREEVRYLRIDNARLRDEAAFKLLNK